jgi:hypothetical protein
MHTLLVVLISTLVVLFIRVVYMGVVFFFFDFTVLERQMHPLELKLLKRVNRIGLTEEDKRAAEEIRERRKRGLPPF